MGIEYYLVKEEEKELFYLGKPNWFMLFDKNEILIKNRYKSPYELYHGIFFHIAPSFDESTSVGYFKDLSEKIFDWAGDSKIRLTSDMDFEDGDEGRENYVETGTRYIKYPSKPKDILKIS